MAFSRILILPVVCLVLLFGCLFTQPFYIFWLYFLPYAGLLFLGVGSWLIPLFWYKLVPYVGRLLTEAARTRKPPALIVHDTGRAALVLVEERRGEGVVITSHGKYKILPRYVGIEAQLTESTSKNEETTESKNEETSAETEESENSKKKEKGRLRDFSDWITKRCILTGLGLPLFVGYSGSLCLMNPETLALVEAGEMYIQTAEGRPIHNPDKGKKGNFKEMSQPLMMLDIRKIKGVVDSAFDESQIAALVMDAEKIGLLGRGFGRYLPVVAIIIIVIAVIAGLMFVPQLLQGMPIG